MARKNKRRTKMNRMNKKGMSWQKIVKAVIISLLVFIVVFSFFNLLRSTLFDSDILKPYEDDEHVTSVERTVTEFSSELETINKNNCYFSWKFQSLPELNIKVTGDKAIIKSSTDETQTSIDDVDGIYLFKVQTTSSSYNIIDSEEIKTINLKKKDDTIEVNVDFIAPGFMNWREWLFYNDEKECENVVLLKSGNKLGVILEDIPSGSTITYNNNAIISCTDTKKLTDVKDRLEKIKSESNLDVKGSLVKELFQKYPSTFTLSTTETNPDNNELYIKDAFYNSKETNMVFKFLNEVQTTYNTYYNKLNWPIKVSEQDYLLACTAFSDLTSTPCYYPIFTDETKLFNKEDKLRLVGYKVNIYNAGKCESLGLKPENYDCEDGDSCLQSIINDARTLYKETQEESVRSTLHTFTDQFFGCDSRYFYSYYHAMGLDYDEYNPSTGTTRNKCILYKNIATNQICTEYSFADISGQKCYYNNGLCKEYS